MSLKQLLFTDCAIKQLPNVIELIQNGSLPDNEMNEIFSNISTLIYGTFSQRKIGLSILKCCLVHLYKSNRLGEHIEMLMKWWKGVVNSMKSRYSPDTTYRLACSNAMILSQISSSYIDLLIEGRANVPAMVIACTSHVCAESFALLQIITQQYPSHVGKHFDEIRAFCLAHVHDEYCVDSARICAQLCCVGPSGKQLTNYTRAWAQSTANCIESLKNLLCGVVSMEAGSLQHPVLPTWQFTSSLVDVEKANKEITFLGSFLKSLMRMSLEVSVVFPLKALKSFVEEVNTAFRESIVYAKTIENFAKKLVINHTVSELLDLLNVVVSTLQTTSFLVLPQIEELLISLLQQSFQVKSVVALLETMTSTGCTIATLPFVMLIDLLTVNSLNHIKGPVTKKQKTEQFSTFTFETSTLGSHDEQVMVSVLKLLNQVLKSCGTSLPHFKTETLKTKCHEIINHKESFSLSLLQHTHETLNTLSCQKFEFKSVLSLSSSSKCSKTLVFTNNQIYNVEPHLHPERHSFRSSSIPHESVKSNCAPGLMEDESNINLSDSFQENADVSWEKEHKALFENLPHNALHSSKETENAGKSKDIEMKDTSASSESDDTESEKSAGDECASNEMDENASFQTLDATKSKLQEQIKSTEGENSLKLQNKSINGFNKENDEINIKSNVCQSEDQSEQLKDILSSFVDEPRSGDEF